MEALIQRDVQDQVQRQVDVIHRSQETNQVQGKVHNDSPTTATANVKQEEEEVNKTLSACERYTFDARRNLSVDYNHFNNPLVSSLVTMIMHMTPERFRAFENSADMWKGSISVFLYGTKSSLEEFTKKFLASSQLKNRKNIYVHFVEASGFHYPSNALRNAAVDFSTKSEYVFLNDVDFVPADNIEQALANHINKKTVTQKQVLIIPAFETKNTNTSAPRNKTSLQEMLRSGSVTPFHFPVFTPGHQPTNFKKWETAESPYEVFYQQYFEPYMVMERKTFPRFAQRFVGRYYDKSSHAMQLYFLKYKFMVAPDSFLVHLYHPQNIKAHEGYFKCAHSVYVQYKRELKDLSSLLSKT